MKGKIVDWGIQEVEKLGNQPKMVIFFDTESGKRKFESFFLKKDGDINKKTFETIVTCGFTGSDASVLAECDNKQLNMEKEFDLTIEQDDGGYEKVEWVNDPDKAQSFGNVDTKKLKGMKFSKAFKEIHAKSKGANTKVSEGPTGIDENEELGF